jgi:hypothetical protein
MSEDIDLLENFNSLSEAGIARENRFLTILWSYFEFWILKRVKFYCYFDD